MSERKHPRLKEHDYSAPGTYFLTICTKNKEPLLSSVVGRCAHTPPCVALLDIGRVVAHYIERIGVVYDGVTVDTYIIMPNHIHLLITIDGAQDGGVTAHRPTTHTIVRSLKTMVTKQIGRPIWHASYYDHIIRNQDQYNRAWTYIAENPAKWADDEYYALPPLS